MGKKSGSESGVNVPDHISESLETVFWVKILKFFDADPGSRMGKFGSGINIPDPQHLLFFFLSDTLSHGAWWAQLPIRLSPKDES
jgi:hypothetical protein